MILETIVLAFAAFSDEEPADDAIDGFYRELGIWNLPIPTIALLERIQSQGLAITFPGYSYKHEVLENGPSGTGGFTSEELENVCLQDILLQSEMHSEIRYMKEKPEVYIVNRGVMVASGWREDWVPEAHPSPWPYDAEVELQVKDEFLILRLDGKSMSEEEFCVIRKFVDEIRENS